MYDVWWWFQLSLPLLCICLSHNVVTLTWTPHSSIFSVRAGPDVAYLISTIQQRRLLSSAAEIVQVYRSHTLSIASTAICRGICKRNNCQSISKIIVIREHGSVLYLGMAKEIYYICITRIMAKEATNPKQKHADGMILPSSSHKYSRRYLSIRWSWETVGFCHLLFSFLLSRTKLLTSIAYKLKHLLSYFTHRMISLSL